MKIGLALGAGGVRGFAHLGVIETLEDAGIDVDVIVGSSIGAAIGSMYAFRPKLAPHITHIQKYLHSELFDSTKLSYLKQSEETRQGLYDSLKIRFAKGAVFASSLGKNSLFTEEVLRSNVEFLLPPVNMEDSLIKVATVAFDLNTGDEILSTSGPVIDAVMASCAIPGVFPPVANGEAFAMDGGIVNPVPCNHAKELGADLVVAVDVAPKLAVMPSMINSYEVALRAGDVSRHYLKKYQLAEADLVINIDTSDIFWADFSQFEHCVEMGREAARAALPKLKAALNNGPAEPDPH